MTLFQLSCELEQQILVPLRKTVDESADILVDVLLCRREDGAKKREVYMLGDQVEHGLEPPEDLQVGVEGLVRDLGLSNDLLDFLVSFT